MQTCFTSLQNHLLSIYIFLCTGFLSIILYKTFTLEQQTGIKDTHVCAMIDPDEMSMLVCLSLLDAIENVIADTVSLFDTNSF